MTSRRKTAAAAHAPLLRSGHNCWRIARAERARVLIDGADYFAMLDAALARAEREILIVGWDVHALMRLVPEKPGAETRAPNLRERLYELATRNASLEIRILLWDFTVLYASDRLPFPKAVLDWSMPANVRLALDGCVPAGASHHQKIVAIDDRLAFIGGLDLTEGRWDTRAHAADEDRRTTARGEPCPPFHDVQLALEGEAAAALAEHCRWRWQRCAGPGAAPPRATGDPWPEGWDPTWRGVPIGIARTLPEYDGEPPVTEIAELFVDLIAAAREYIYIENQYLTADRVCEALAERLAEADGPEVVLVTRASSSSWLEQNTMGVRRSHFLTRLREADAHGRLLVCAPRVRGVPIGSYRLHSKVAIVDDRYVRIGSANLNNRSMGLDTECDAIVDCREPRDRDAARRLRNDLVAEHLGIEADTLEAEIAARGSLAAAIAATGPVDDEPLDAARGGRSRDRGLVELPPPAEPAAEAELLAELADPDGPLSAQDLLDRLVPDGAVAASAGGVEVGRIVKVAGAIAVAVALILLWRTTNLGASVDPDAVARLLGAAAASPLGAPVALAAFVLGGLVVFPVTVLIVATGVAFGPWLGLLYAILGAYLSAAVNFEIGRRLGRGRFERFGPKLVQTVNRRLARNGVVATALLRIVPIAPFAIVNLLAGLAPIRFRDFALGTVLGMTPGIVVLVVLGGQLNALLENPSLGKVLGVAALAALWIATGFALQRLMQRLERRRGRARARGHADATDAES